MSINSQKPSLSFFFFFMINQVCQSKTKFFLIIGHCVLRNLVFQLINQMFLIIWCCALKNLVFRSRNKVFQRATSNNSKPQQTCFIIVKNLAFHNYWTLHFDKLGFSFSIEKPSLKREMSNNSKTWFIILKNLFFRIIGHYALKNLVFRSKNCYNAQCPIVRKKKSFWFKNLIFWIIRHCTLKPPLFSIETKFFEKNHDFQLINLFFRRKIWFFELLDIGPAINVHKKCCEIRIIGQLWVFITLLHLFCWW